MRKSGRSLSFIIIRHVAGEALFAFFVSFLFFFFVFFVNQLLLMVQELLSKHVPLYQVGLLLFYSLPSVIAMAAPFGALLGVVMTIGRLSSDNEVLVMLSSGLSYKNIFLPALAVGVFVTLISFFANDVLLPAGTVRFSRLYRRILFSTPALELESNSVKRFRNTILVTGAVQGKAIDNMLIFDRTGEGERRVIIAKKAELTDSGTTRLSLDLHDSFIQSSKETRRTDYDYSSASFLRYSVNQSDLWQTQSAIGPREMSSTDVRREIKEKEASLAGQIDDIRLRTAGKALALERMLRAGPSHPDWNRRTGQRDELLRELENIRARRKDRNLLFYRLEYYKKFSIPAGAFCLAFLSIPLGLFSRRSGQVVGLLFGLLVSVLYWALLLGGQTMGMRLGYSPFWSMWLPNALALAAGAVLCIIRVRQ
ncbi:MAG: LptF/LptG family permease [Spirochaetaceae bacterium]|jgi:lipopolysaccharide export system permease protein|nr:LptF/LptG family permease [Spirochaetaceae bacterium]